MSTLALTVILAFVLDKLFAEPKRFHPLVGFGNYVSRIESWLNQGESRTLKGVLAVIIAILPWLLISVVLTALIAESSLLNVIVSAVVLYLAVGWQSLLQHAQQIVGPLKTGNLEQARTYVSWIVSRDTDTLDDTQVAKAATESVLENGADAIFAAVFCFCLMGIPGVVLYRCSNTLDAMWGYKNERFLSFGWAAARLDDVLNYIPARLTALSYALMGNTKQALDCWQRKGHIGKSPNAGPVMASGAGALNVSLGGAASYHNRIEQKPVLGPEEDENTRASADSITHACDLVNKTLVMWIVVIMVMSWGISVACS
ncbi:adenosylcobinamide-phosphate synthase CbiB [Litoribrevibacter euphylliae]|uniref:Cobalamin biosynthesis protein CobD n=1 Tax=Litoribrevibacter euphylliae TaxID=1834034 RepID=A0ABV7HI69_9GAMM